MLLASLTELAVVDKTTLNRSENLISGNQSGVAAHEVRTSFKMKLYELFLTYYSWYSSHYYMSLASIEVWVQAYSSIESTSINIIMLVEQV